MSKTPKGWKTLPDLGRRQRGYFWYKRHDGGCWTDRVWIEVVRVNADLMARIDAIGWCKPVNQMPQGVWFDAFQGDPEAWETSR